MKLITRLRDIFVWPVQRQPILTDQTMSGVSAVATCFSWDLTAHSYRNLKCKIKVCHTHKLKQVCNANE